MGRKRKSIKVEGKTIPNGPWAPQKGESAWDFAIFWHYLTLTPPRSYDQIVGAVIQYNGTERRIPTISRLKRIAAPEFGNWIYRAEEWDKFQFETLSRRNAETKAGLQNKLDEKTRVEGASLQDLGSYVIRIRLQRIRRLYKELSETNDKHKQEQIEKKILDECSVLDSIRLIKEGNALERLSLGMPQTSTATAITGAIDHTMAGEMKHTHQIDRQDLRKAVEQLSDEELNMLEELATKLGKRDAPTVRPAQPSPDQETELLTAGDA